MTVVPASVRTSRGPALGLGSPGLGFALSSLAEAPSAARAALSGLSVPVVLAHPRRAASALARLAPRPARTWHLRRAYSRSLPYLRTNDKATFNTAYFTTTAREFGRQWDGGGVDPDLVDVRSLQEEWLKALPSAPSSALLQAAWLAQAGGGRGAARGPPFLLTER
ncbi:MAG: hypothetical protein ACRDZX_14385 [Acidimicrobiales bacterium]